MDSEYPKKYFWLPYAFTLAAMVTFVLQMQEDIVQFPLGLALGVGFLAAAIIIAVRGFRGGMTPQETPAKYTPRHYYALLSHSLQTGALAFGLHGALYALFWFVIRIFETGDEPVFFVILVIIVPAGFIAGAVGKLWDWSVVKTVRAMKEIGIVLPAAGRYYAPFGSYAWLWKYAKGVAALSAGRIPAGGAFCAVFFLGIVGFFIIRRALDYHLKRMLKAQSSAGGCGARPCRACL